MLPGSKMTTLIVRLAGTVLLFALALTAIYFGMNAVFSLQARCEPLLPFAACRSIVMGLAALCLFAVFYLTMSGANKIWGRQLFKRDPE